VATHLVDKSAYARLHVREVADRLAPMLFAGRVATTGIGMLEMLSSAMNAEFYVGMRRELDGMPRVAVTERIVDRALEVQGLMVRRGTHRAPSAADLVLAACAEQNGLTLLHYDADYDLIAEVTGQPVEWVVPQGSI
jgi:hypothetical protein